MTNTNEIVDTIVDAASGVEVKHFALTVDKDGKEMRVEINPQDETPVEAAVETNKEQA